MSNIIKGQTYEDLKIALDGLALRQQVISRNIANVDTPGYQAQNVSFEQVIKQAAAKAEPLALSVTNVGHMQLDVPSPTVTLINRVGGSDRVDGNNVDIDAELTEMNDTAIRYQALAQMISRKYTGIVNILAMK
jgi:flagellar basal-body rod protein FlgB